MNRHEYCQELQGFTSRYLLVGEDAAYLVTPSLSRIPITYCPWCGKELLTREPHYMKGLESPLEKGLAPT